MTVHIDSATAHDDTSCSREQLRVIETRGCVKCGAKPEPEPTDEERERLLADPDFTWEPAEGTYVRRGFGLAGGGFGPYAWCEGCGEVWKVDIDTEAA